MNKLLIGLLIIAAGAGTFFFLRKKSQATMAGDMKKEWIVGNWKIADMKAGNDSGDHFMVGIMGMVDSNTIRYQYRFTKEGTILRSLGDSVTSDTSHYDWDKDQLIWKDQPEDSTGSLLRVVQLSKDSLQLLTKDSTVVLFTKLR